MAPDIGALVWMNPIPIHNNPGGSNRTKGEWFQVRHNWGDLLARLCRRGGLNTMTVGKDLFKKTEFTGVLSEEQAKLFLKKRTGISLTTFPPTDHVFSCTYFSAQ